MKPLKEGCEFCVSALAWWEDVDAAILAAVVLSFVFSPFAQADYPAQYTTTIASIGVSQPSAAAACAAAAAHYVSTGNLGVTVVSNTATSCVLQQGNYPAYPAGPGNPVYQFSLPMVQGAANCAAGGTPTAGVCVNGCGTTGSTIGPGLVNFGAVSSGAPLVCNGGCEQQFSGAMYGRAIVGGAYQYFGQGTLTRTGQSCTGGVTASTAGAVPDTTCPTGYTVGTINGVSKCYSTSTGQPGNPNTGQTPAAVTTTVASGGCSGCTTHTTTNSDNSTTTTIYNSAGNKVSEQTTGGDPLKKFCEENAAAPICSKTSFTGSCSSSFVCGGDAVNCAIASAINQIQCTLSVDSGATNAAALAAASLTSAKSDWNAKKSTTDMSGALHFNERTISARTCPAPRAVTTYFGEISFSWQMFCDLAETLSVFLLMGSIVLGVRIMVGGA